MIAPGLKAIGVDLGGTKIEAAAIITNSDGFETLARKRIPTNRDRGYDAVINACAGLISGIAKEAGFNTDVPTGIGMPGAITRRDGLIKNSNTTCLNGRPFREDLRKRLGFGIMFENDANCFALAEAHLGAGKGLGAGLVFGVILGTGAGGGFIVNGHVWRGMQWLGGEWGHHVIYAVPGLDAQSEKHGIRKCYCGHSGCVEAYVSGPAVEKDYKTRSGRPLSLSEISAAALAGDRHAQGVIDLFLDSFARGIANVINIIDPDLIVLGGGVSNLDCLYDEGVKRIGTLVFNDELATPVVRNKLGDSAGVFGAAVLALQG